MNYESFYKWQVLERLSKLCEPHEWEYMEAAFNGDATDWQVGHDRYEAKKNKRQSALQSA